MACAVNAAEANLTTVLIVPLVSLLNNLTSCLRKKGICIIEWTEKVTHYSTHVTIVISNLAATSAFIAYFLKGCAEKRIAHAVFDKIHFLLTSSHFCLHLYLIKCLREGSVPFLCLTATACYEAILKIMTQMHLLPGNTLLIRAPTLGSEIVYSVLKLTSLPNCQPIEASYSSINGQYLRVMDYIKGFIDTFQPKERALIFCLSKWEAEGVAAALQCQYYHLTVEDKQKQLVINSWREGKQKVLAATSALGAGFDYAEVKLVVHYGKPRNILEFSQESG